MVLTEDSGGQLRRYRSGHRATIPVYRLPWPEVFTRSDCAPAVETTDPNGLRSPADVSGGCVEDLQDPVAFAVDFGVVEAGVCGGEE